MTPREARSRAIQAAARASGETGHSEAVQALATLSLAWSAIAAQLPERSGEDRAAKLEAAARLTGELLDALGSGPGVDAPLRKAQLRGYLDDLGVLR